MNQVISNLLKSHPFDFSLSPNEHRAQYWDVLVQSVRGTDVIIDVDAQRLKLASDRAGPTTMEITFRDPLFAPSLAGAVDSGSVITTICDGAIGCHQHERIAKSFLVLDPEENLLVLRTAWHELWPNNLKDFDLLHRTETLSEGVIYLVIAADSIIANTGARTSFSKPTPGVVRAIVSGKGSASMAVMQIQDCLYTYNDICRLNLRRVHFGDAGSSRGEITRTFTQFLSGGIAPAFTVSMTLSGEHAVLNWTWLRNLASSLSTFCSDWRSFDFTSHIRLATAEMPTDQLRSAHRALEVDTHRDGCRKLELIVGVANSGLKLVLEALGQILTERAKWFQADADARSTRLMPLYRTEYPIIVTERGPAGERPVGRLANAAAFALYKASQVQTPTAAVPHFVQTPVN